MERQIRRVGIGLVLSFMAVFLQLNLGALTSGDPALQRGLHAFDAANDAWRKLATAPLSGREAAATVWTGTVERGQKSILGQNKSSDL